jgi:hypothetical protein
MGAEPHQRGRDPVARKKDGVDQERYQVLKRMLEERRLEGLVLPAVALADEDAQELAFSGQ